MYALPLLGLFINKILCLSIKKEKKKGLSLLCMIEFRTCRTRSSHVHHISGSWHVHTENFMAFLLTLNHLKLMIGFSIVHIYCLYF